MKKRGFSRGGQVTIFVIIALLIIAGIIIYFSVRTLVGNEFPKEMKPVYDYYLECLNEHAQQGINLLGEQGGYINVPDFVPGSQYMPFSSQLDFFGQPVPYWMYVSGNNLLKEQVPTKNSMEEQLKSYLELRADECDFSDFNQQGYDVFIDEENINFDVEINELNVKITADVPMNIYFNGDSVSVKEHKISINSKLGKFYNMALDVYNFEKTDMFLEKYAVDVLRLYAPVDGVDISCAPKVFVDEKIREDLIEGLAENVAMLKLKGSYYSLSTKDNNYFVTNIGRKIDENVNFIYSSDWPTRIEIYGDRVVEPVGLQEGLGILGFCYVPYHLIYDVDFPVLIQFYDNKELFQFPIAVIIDKNQKREALPTTAGITIESDACQYKNQESVVYTYDSQLNPVEANIKFKCLNSECVIGRTEIKGYDAVLSASLPQCVNGFLVANAEGYAESKYQISTNTESVANIILNKLYDIPLDLENVESALVNFESDDYSTQAFYPDMKSVKLVDGYYNVTVYAYRNSSLKFPSVSERKCFSVPQEGIGGVFGAEEERCFDINIPESDVSFAVVGGGRTTQYISENQLIDAQELNINIPLFGIPSSLQDLQNNYLQVEESVVYLQFE